MDNMAPLQIVTDPEPPSDLSQANSLVNSAIEDCSITKLRAVVLDELHMVDDGRRGYLLELLTTKLLCLGQPIQIVGMSATLSVSVSLPPAFRPRSDSCSSNLQNIGLLKTWLDAHSYETHYRPVPIHEHLVYDGKIYAAETNASLLKTLTQLGSASATTPRQNLPQPLRIVRPSTHKELLNPVRNAVVALAYETVCAGHGVLIFSSSRVGCESDALLLSQVLPPLEEADPAIQEKRRDLLGDLRSLSTGLDPKLEKTIPAGVAFHRECCLSLTGGA
jgi:replicative superfamily II helicase